MHESEHKAWEELLDAYTMAGTEAGPLESTIRVRSPGNFQQPPPTFGRLRFTLMTRAGVAVLTLPSRY